jgi:hypothetical protein
VFKIGRRKSGDILVLSVDSVTVSKSLYSLEMSGSLLKICDI